jgi:hypothetical protein
MCSCCRSWLASCALPNKQSHHHLYLSIWSQSLHCLWLFGGTIVTGSKISKEKKFRRLCWQGYCYRAWVLYLDSHPINSQNGWPIVKLLSVYEKTGYHSSTFGHFDTCLLNNSLINFEDFISTNDTFLKCFHQILYFPSEKIFLKNIHFVQNFQHLWK